MGTLWSLSNTTYPSPYCHLHSTVGRNGGRWISKAKFTSCSSSRLGSPWPRLPAPASPSLPGKYNVCSLTIELIQDRKQPSQNQCLLWAWLSIQVWCEVGACTESCTHQGLALEERGVKWEPQINTKQVLAHIQAGSSQTSHAANAGCTARGVLTRCLVKRFALRLSHYHSAQCREHFQHCRLPSLQEPPE